MTQSRLRAATERRRALGVDHRMRGTGAARLSPPVAIALASTTALAVVLALAPSVPHSRDGIDSTNFALAIDRYDPAEHQPHPPGYPIHVAFGRVIASAYRAVGDMGAEVATAVASLRLWSLFCGLLAAFGIRHVALALGASSRGAWLSTVMLASCPLYLVTVVRPLSDAPGLLFVLAAQLAVLSAGNAVRGEVAPQAGRWPWQLMLGALLSGLAVGVRVQTALLTIPLLLVAMLSWPAWRRPRVALSAVLAVAVGVSLWATPMLLVVGIDEYWRLVNVVAVDDLQGVEMLATQPTPRVLLTAVVNTFIEPWRWGWLAAIAACLSLRGAVLLALREPRHAGLLAVIAGPYLAFHLVFQETASIRYALPIVATQVVLMAAGASRSRIGLALACLVVAGGSVTSAMAADAYWRGASPVAQALGDLEAQSGSALEPPALAFHHAVVRAARGSAWPGPQLAAPVRYEWLEVAEYFAKGGTRPVWFLANRRRTDLALFDARSRRLLHSYQWPEAVAPLLGGIQPRHVLWHEIRDPGWMLARGWSLTPETHGVSRRDGHTPGGLGTTGWIRRRASAAVMMIGGRNLGGPCDTGARVEVAIDGGVVAEWTAGPHVAFLQTVPLAAGTLVGPGSYAALRVTARDAAGTTRLVDVAIESFDLQSAGAMVGLGAGWHVPEADVRTGQQWRWMDERGVLHVEGFGRDVELTLRGRVPPGPSSGAARVEVRAGEAVLGTFAPTADFEWTGRISAAALAAADGQVSLDSSRWFIPDERRGNGDRRRLSLQVFDVVSWPSPQGLSTRVP